MAATALPAPGALVGFRRFLWDLSGAFGDIGVLLPIAVVLIARNGLNPTAVFLAAGLFYLASARHFKITMPVQPLKAMSAIAIAGSLSPQILHAAGMIMGVLLLALAVSGLGSRLGRLFPVAVIRGLQLGLGLVLVRASLEFLGADGVTAAAAAAILLAGALVLRSVPPLIPLLVFGVALAASRASVPHLGPVALAPALPTVADLATALTQLVLPQIALTIGNAVIATEDTAKRLYGERAARLNLTSIPLSMGIANIASAILGGAPMCHGSGGLTAHRSFGATTHRSGVIIGVTFVALGLLLGSSAVQVIQAVPVGILGVMLCYVGIQHGLLVRDIVDDRSALVVALATAAIGAVTGNLAAGCLAGIAIHHAAAGFRSVLRRAAARGADAPG